MFYDAQGSEQIIVKFLAALQMRRFALFEAERRKRLDGLMLLQDELHVFHVCLHAANVILRDGSVSENTKRVDLVCEREEVLGSFDP